MALIDLKSNLASFRSDFSTPSVATQTEMPTKQLKKAQQTQASRATVDRTNWIDSVVINDFKNTGPTGWQPGKFTLRSQLGDGKSPLIRSYDPLITNTYNWYNSDGKVSPHTGFYSKDNTYQIKATKKGFLAATYNTNSPVDDVYKKFSLQDEAYNPTYIKQPFIVRGIQRKGNETPQYWGFGSRSGFDDGLIRGGVVTVADRVVADTVRIAKFMASPKGLLWIVKQVGLGLTNAKVEAVGGTFGRQTRIHTGVTSLLSVVGAPFGLHFTRHGLPFANEIASYGNVINTKQLPLVGNPSYSRLVDLQNEFDAGKLYSNKILEGLSKVKIFKTKSLGSAILSGLGGPGSVYGIGFTQIRRVVDTKTDAVARAEKLNFTQTYGVEAQYASTISKGILKTSIDSDKDKRTIDDIENNKPVLIGFPNAPKSIFSKANKSDFGKRQTPGAGKIGSIETNAGKVTAYPNSPQGNINNYITMAYGKIPKNSSDKIALKGDFRNALEKDTKGFTGIPNDYVKNSLEGRYGFGKLGEVGAVRTDPSKFLVDSKDFTKKKKDRFVLINKGDAFRGDKVTAIDIASPGKNNQVYTDTGQDLITFYFEDGEEGTNVMPFRCTMTGYSDSFTPGWDRIDIMGRPDGAYLYTTFERSVSFNFTVAALSRSEMIPMWRKLNYLSTYTMPDFNGSARPSGPFMRISIGSLFKNTPGFISSLTYTVPDDTNWDIAEDAKTNKNAKQLPMVVDVAMSFTVVGDFRPQMMGRAYSLQGEGDWLKDSVTKLGSKSKGKK
jgi:hypothetical protein